MYRGLSVRVCLFVCRLDTNVRNAKMAEPIKVPFGV